jgi:hypothetical protein
MSAIMESKAWRDAVEAMQRAWAEAHPPLPKMTRKTPLDWNRVWRR